MALVSSKMQPQAENPVSWKLEISLLGAFRVYLNGNKVLISRRKTQALLAYLAVTNQPHTREALMLLLWPDEEQSLARSNLRRILSELSTLIGKDFFSIERDQVSVNPNLPIYVDVADFKHKVLEARQHEHNSLGSCGECLEDLKKAVELYTGDFLTGFNLPDSRTFDDWLFFETESLHQLLAECLQTLVKWLSNSGDLDAAIEYARRFLALDPLHEPAHRMLMRLYALSGRQSAALRQYEECVQLLRKELKVKPEQETITLYEAIRSRQIEPVAHEHEILPDVPFPGSVSSTRSQPNNLTRISTQLIGRKNELAKIIQLIGHDESCRLVTLTGPGGSGKTRLALEAAARLADDPNSNFQHGIWFVSLAPLTIARGIPDKIAQALNVPIPEGGEQTRLMLLDFLRSKRMVLVLDNFEHLAGEESISLIMDILAAAPDVKFLVTSRERLHIRDEQIVLLAGLQTTAELVHANDAHTIASVEAIQMFSQCAARLNPDFEITEDDLPAIVHICHLVEGMPLGIQLAAAWLDVLSPVEIAAEIEKNLDFLESDWRDLPERQHSLRAVFESSWSLLSEPERQVLVALAVFRSGFSRQAAESTAGVSLKMLLALVHKSWISQAESGRYSIHELLRQYLSEKLQSEPGLYRNLMENYSSYYAGFLDRQADIMRGPKQLDAFNAIATEYENIMLAWEWFRKHKKVPEAVELMLPALFYFCAVRNKGIEISQLVECTRCDYQAEELENAAPITLAILFTAQAAIHYLGFPNYPETLAPSLNILNNLNEAWSLAGSEEFLESLGFWGTELAYVYGRVIDRELGMITLRGLINRFNEDNLEWEKAFTLSYLGQLTEPGGPLGETKKELFDIGQEVLLEAANIFSRLGDMLQCGYALGMLGNLCFDGSDQQRPIDYWLSAREKLQQGGDRILAVHMLVQIGEAYILTCEFEEGFNFFQSAAYELLDMGFVNEAALVFSKEALYASRYSNFEHARRVREQSIELSHQKNDGFSLAWHCWEMGELLRLEGDLQSAREWYDKAIPLIEVYENPLGFVFYKRGLGDLSQAAGSSEESYHYFEESLLQAEQINHVWSMVYTLAGLGRAETSLCKFDAAGEHFKRGYSIAKESGYIDLMLVILAGLAGLCAATGEKEKAISLAGLVVRQQQSWRETKNQAVIILNNLGIEQESVSNEPENACSSNVVELDNLVAKIEAQFTSQWLINCA